MPQGLGRRMNPHTLSPFPELSGTHSQPEINLGEQACEDGRVPLGKSSRGSQGLSGSPWVRVSAL